MLKRDLNGGKQHEGGKNCVKVNKYWYLIVRENAKQRMFCFYNA